MDADCGERVNAKVAMCFHGDFCHLICQDHWGDCNEDYRDGCETPIKDRVYCDGDPRIESERASAPSVGVLVTGADVGAGKYEVGDFSVGLGPYRRQLQQCYEDALGSVPELEGALDYQITLSTSGRISSIKQVTSDANGPELEGCIRDYAEAVQFSRGAVGGAVTFPCRFIFTK